LYGSKSTQLKAVLLLVVIVFIIIAIIALVAPDYYVLHSYIVIRAPLNVVIGQIVKFENFIKWEPWGIKNVIKSINIIGRDGEEGTIYSWSGIDSFGSGSLELFSISDDNINVRVTIKSPWESQAYLWYKIVPFNDGYKVIWGVKSSMLFPLNIIAMFMGAKSMIERDLNEGLANLKVRCESQAKILSNEVRTTF